MSRTHNASTSKFTVTRRRALVAAAALGLALAVPGALANEPTADGANEAETAVSTAAPAENTAAPNTEAAPAESTAATWHHDPLYTKSQVVYVKLDGEGGQEGVWVVNAFEARSTVSVEDDGSYRSLVNLTDTQELVNRDAAVEFEANNDETFIYQGELDPWAQTPWIFELTYWLNGEEVEPQELAGRSGRVRMELHVTANPACNNVYAANYLLQVNGTLDGSSTSQIGAPGATLAHSGDNTALTYMVMPSADLDVTYAVEAIVEGFEFDGWQVVGIPLSMSIEVDDGAFESSTNKMDELESGIAELSTGTGNLSDSISNDLLVGVDELAAGSATLASTLATDAQAARDSAAAIDVAAAQATYEAALGAWAQAYAVCIVYGIDPAYDEAQLAAAAALQEATAALVTAQAQVAGHNAAAQALDGVAAGYAPVDAALQDLVDPESEESLHALANGAASLAEGAALLAEGTTGLASQVVEGAKQNLDDYLNPQFELVDFVNGDTQVIDSVQFVYMTGAVEVPEEEAVEEVEEELTFTDKLLALFE